MGVPLRDPPLHNKDVERSVMANLASRIQQHHLARGPARPEILQRVFAAVPVPRDMREFYELLGEGADLFDETYRLLPADDITRIDVGDPARQWFTFCDVGDGNFVAFDAASVRGRTCNVIDCFHETVHAPGQRAVIARSFDEFVARALDSRGELYWLEDGFVGYGRV